MPDYFSYKANKPVVLYLTWLQNTWKDDPTQIAFWVIIIQWQKKSTATEWCRLNLQSVQEWRIHCIINNEELSGSPELGFDFEGRACQEII